MHEGPIDSAFAPGWYPDPAGKHDHRYHNGSTWTADVSTDGVRSVQALPPSPGSGHRSSRGSGTLPLALGIVSMATGWIPFVCFVAVVVAVVAIALGLRRRSDPRMRGAATAAVVTGTVGLVLAVAGIWISVVVVAAVSRFERPGAYEASIDDCREVDGGIRASGTIVNLESDTRSYTVTVAFDDEWTASVTVDDVAPGAEARFEVEEDLRSDRLDCRVDSVEGPRPFGFDPDR